MPNPFAEEVEELKQSYNDSQTVRAQGACAGCRLDGALGRQPSMFSSGLPRELSGM